MDTVEKLMSYDSVALAITILFLLLSLNANRVQYGDRRKDFKSVHETLEHIREMLAVVTDRLKR